MTRTVSSKIIPKEMGAYGLVQLLKVLVDENRLKIIACLATGEKCVCQLTDSLDISQNLMSHHLRVLRESGLVTDERRGRWIYYSLKTETLDGWLDLLKASCHCSSEQAANSCK